jgi:hypothetical protein
MNTPDGDSRDQRLAAGAGEDAAARPELDRTVAHSRFPAGTTPEDCACWVCGGPTNYRQCRIVCSICGFTRDCSDP